MDQYDWQIALDSHSNVFMVGQDYGVTNPNARGRLIGLRGTDGSEFLSYAVPESNSQICGVAVDGEDNLYIAYSYNMWLPGGAGTTQQERTVIQKMNEAGQVLWSYTFPEIGMTLDSLAFWSTAAIAMRDNDHFYLAYSLAQDGSRVPGVTEFDSNGNLLFNSVLSGSDNVGWGVNRLDADGDKVYLGLFKVGDDTKSRMLGIDVIPEPGTMALIAPALLGFAGIAFRKMRKG